MSVFWLIQRRYDADRYPISETVWKLDVAKRRVDEILTHPTHLRWLRLVEYHPDSPATVLIDWQP